MDIIGFGALNFDRLYKVDALNTGDDELHIKDEHEAPGGSGANTIYALGKLGLKVGFVGAVGGDSEGREILDSFKSAGVDTTGIAVKDDLKSSLILGFVDNTGERALYVSPRANSALAWQDIDIEYATRSKMLLLSSFVSEEQLNLQKKLLESLPESVKVIFTPGALYSRRGLEALKPILERTDLLFINTEEIKLLLNEDYQSGVKQLMEIGIDTIAVTLGPEGCYIKSKEHELEVPALETDVVDTTGAGDAFAAGFIWALARNKDMETCARTGNFVASKCIEVLGARAGIPSEPELNAYLDK
jgi:ribokinase